MKVHNYPCKLSSPTAVALGRFDGVHLAHKAVISAAVSEKSKGLVPAVFTFCDNPNKKASFLLATEEEKRQLIKNCGTEIMINATFDSVCNLSAQEFVTLVLKDALGAKAVFCGYNYRFGKGASADAHTLQTLCEKEGIEVTCVEEFVTEDITVSSTEIRSLLSAGDVTKAKRLLGRAYTLSGQVVHGNAIGRTIDTPTLNVAVSPEKLLPKFGVYACYALIDGKAHKSVANIGLKPTVGSESPTVEAFLLDTQGDFYEKCVTLELVSFIRPEQKFDSLIQLREAIDKDIEKAKEALK
ncbi:MAG: bifunctional riboflavin kinase/FAD synthetase [Ruminococcus sp.]|nr:bifunctional riboflavin kinase/FAD synthetase [Ruminococcus sp.]